MFQFKMISKKINLTEISWIRQRTKAMRRFCWIAILKNSCRSRSIMYRNDSKTWIKTLKEKTRTKILLTFFKNRVENWVTFFLSNADLSILILLSLKTKTFSNAHSFLKYDKKKTNDVQNQRCLNDNDIFSSYL